MTKKNGWSNTKANRIYLVDQMTRKQKQHRGRISETYGTMKRSMTKDRPLTVTKVGVMTRTVKIKFLEEIGQNVTEKWSRKGHWKAKLIFIGQRK